MQNVTFITRIFALADTKQIQQHEHTQITPIQNQYTFAHTYTNLVLHSNYWNRIPLTKTQHMIMILYGLYITEYIQYNPQIYYTNIIIVLSANVFGVILNQSEYNIPILQKYLTTSEPLRYNSNFVNN